MDPCKPFKGGLMKILARAKADGIEPLVVPMALTNLWGSYFSRVEPNGAMKRPFRRGVFSTVGLNIGAPVAADRIEQTLLRETVVGLHARG